MNEFPEFFDEKGIIKLTPDGSHPVENTPLFHVTYLLHKEDFSESAVVQVLDFISLSGKSIKGTRSHDNTTAILTYLVRALDEGKLSKEREFIVKDIIERFEILPDYTHPRDFIYIAYLQRRFWAFLLLPLLLPIFLYMAIVKYKVRPHLLDWIKDGFPERRKIFKTDTEILYWIRLNLPKRFLFIHLTRFLVVPLLKIKYADDWVSFMMDTYYNAERHPNRILPRRKNES